MTRGSSINFKKSSAGFEHNDRTEKREPKHLLPEEFRQENECDRSAIEAKMLLAEMVENAKKEYQARTGQKCQAKILSVEAVINLEAHHTLDDVKKINDYLEQKHGFRAVQSSIHRDEGHINNEGKPEYNLHAHVVYCNLDKEGKTILKGLEKADLRELQTFVSEALEMTRGQSADISNAKHKTPQEWRYEKVLEQNQELKKELQKSEKSLNLYKSSQPILVKDNEELKKERKTLKEELQALKEQKAIERVTLQENNALRADYAQMEAKYKALEEKIRGQTKSPKEIIEKVNLSSNEAISRTIQEIAESVEVKDGSGLLGNGTKKETVVKLDKLNQILLPNIREVNRISFDILAENTPKTVDTKQVERLEKELIEERKKNFELTFELKQLKEKTQEVWENIKERFKFEGSRLQSTMGNLLDFSKKDPKELDNQKSKGLER